MYKIFVDGEPVGFSKFWIDANGPVLGKPVHEDFDCFNEIVSMAHKQGKYVGCAVRPYNVKKWFTVAELEKLNRMGFGFVDCSKCEILAESSTQAIIASRLPLKYLPKIRYDVSYVDTIAR